MKAVERRRVTVYECGGCHRKFYVEPGDEPPDGIQGVAQERHEMGGTGSEEFFACGRSCLEKAVINALTDGALD